MIKQLICCTLLLLVSQLQAQNKTPNYTIESFNGAVTLPEGNIKDQLQELKATGHFDGNYFGIIQFYEIPKLAERKELERLGCQLVAYYDAKAYFAKFSSSLNITQVGGDKIRAIGSIPNHLKMDVAIYQQQYGKQTIVHSNQLKVELAYFPNASSKNVIADLQKMGVKILQKDANYHQLVIQVAKKKLNALVAKPYVLRISETEGPQAMANASTAERENNSVRANYLRKIYGIDGTGVVVGINDLSRVDRTEKDFRNRLIYKSTDMTSPGQRHATWVAMHSMRAGSVTPIKWGISNLDILTPISGSSNATYRGFYNNDNMRIVNRSLGNAGDLAAGSYNSSAQDIDKLCKEKNKFMIVYSSGNGRGKSNRGSYGLYTNLASIDATLNKHWARLTGSSKQSKNTICVNSFTIDDGPTWSGSTGPAFDGRLKPDICAQGGATSYSAPKAAALIGALYQAYKQAHGGTEPPAAYIKAIILNTADDVYNLGPDFRTGFGKINGRRAYEAMQDTLRNVVLMDDGDTTYVNASIGTIPSGDWAQLKVMVYWADTAHNTTANKALVNDVDLEVYHNGAWQLPLVADHTDPDSFDVLAKPRKDHRNNVEQVTINNPVAGQNWQLRLIGYDVPTGPQKCYVVYHLVPKKLTLTHPLGGESFKPDEFEYIRWDADGYPTGTKFDIDYWNETTSQWTNIALVNGDKRFHKWKVPTALEGMHQTKIRIQKDGDSDLSDTLSISDLAKGLKVDWRCDNGTTGEDAGIRWKTVKDAAAYEVYRLGQYDRHMQLYTTTTDTTAVITNLSMTDTTDWVAVLPVRADGLKGRRCSAVEIELGEFSCNRVSTIGATHVEATEAVLHAKLLPRSQTLTNLQFEYKDATGQPVPMGTLDAGIYSSSSTIYYQQLVTGLPNLNTGDMIEYQGKRI
ncbi:MAG: S8 family peptidase [Aureispira sp.]|nr:S8 family peptidase [Aureispira sp.]